MYMKLRGGDPRNFFAAQPIAYYPWRPLSPLVFHTMPTVSLLPWLQRCLLVLGLLGSVFAMAQEPDLQVTDNLGYRVTLQQPAQRIVSLAPHITELLFSAGAGGAVVAAVSYSDYPEQAKALPQVGSYDRIDLEALLALKPDLIVAWPSGNPDATLDFLSRHSIPVFLSEPRSFAQIADTIRQLGRLAGTENDAEASASHFERRIDQLTQRYRHAKPARTFYQVWEDPLMTVSADHIISKVMALCGGKHLFPSLNGMAANIGLESVLASNPEVIFLPQTNSQWRQQWQRWPQLQAVRDERVFTVDPDHLSRPTARIADGAEEVCSYLQPGTAS